MKTIEAHELSRNFGKLCAVENISFDVRPGEIFGFLGPNGAGKTTTIRMLTGQLRPTSGSARVAGWDIVSQRDQLMPCIGVVFEYQNIYSRLSALDNLLFTAGLYGIGRDRVEEILHTVGLAGRARERTRQFSNGMKQRLLIGRALLHRPQVLFLDEPTRGLDPGVARAIRNLVCRLASDGVSVFLTTHYMDEADQLCQRVAIIDHGRIVACDSPSALKSKYKGEQVSLEDVFIRLTGNELYL